MPAKRDFCHYRRGTRLTREDTDWNFMAEQPAPAPHLARSERRAALTQGFTRENNRFAVLFSCFRLSGFGWCKNRDPRSVPTEGKSFGFKFDGFGYQVSDIRSRVSGFGYQASGSAITRTHAALPARASSSRKWRTLRSRRSFRACRTRAFIRYPKWEFIRKEHSSDTRNEHSSHSQNPLCFPSAARRDNRRA